MGCPNAVPVFSAPAARFRESTSIWAIIFMLLDPFGMKPRTITHDVFFAPLSSLASHTTRPIV